MISSSSIFLILVNTFLVSSYRHLHFTNADVCDPKGTTKIVHIGEGAIVLSLNNDSFATFDKLKEEKKICNIMIKTRKDLGLMVQAENVFLRSEPRNESNEVCIDYIEFGREDIIPFLTMERSGKLCGNKTGYHYEEPGGQLLIWLKLGPYRPLPNRASLSTARLSLIITPFEKRRPCKTCGFMPCKSGKKTLWIRNEYFCDGRKNCPLNGFESSDEEPRACLTTAAPPTTPPTQRPSFASEKPPPDVSSSWDFSFIFIALISIIGLLVIACGIVCTLKKCNLGLLPQTPDNCPDTSFGMLELSRMPNRSQENTYIVHPPCQRPERPTDFLVGPPHLSPSWTRTRPAQNTQSTGERQRPQTSYSPTPAPSNSIRMPKQSPLLSPSETEAPPPSYHDIFPPDYVPDAAVMRGEQNATEI